MPDTWYLHPPSGTAQQYDYYYSVVILQVNTVLILYVLVL